MASLYVPAGQAPTPFSGYGFISVRRLKVSYMWIYVTRSRFPSKDAVKVRLRINDHDVLMAEGDDLGRSLRRTATLSKGHNRIQIAYRSPKNGDAALRVRWQSDSFPVESIPPQASVSYTG